MIYIVMTVLVGARAIALMANPPPLDDDDFSPPPEWQVATLPPRWLRSD